MSEKDKGEIEQYWRKSMKKGILSVFLALAMVVSSLAGFAPAQASAAVSSASALTYNTGIRDNYDVTLSEQALAYYTGNYAYDVLDDLSGTDLFTALHALMKNTMTASVTYSSLVDYWEYTDAEGGDDGRVLFYADLDENTVTTTINREHVWAKSNASFYELGGGADLHHLRPADSKVNSARSNYIMGTIEDRDSYTIYLTSDGISYPAGYVCNSVFEPLDNVKGDVARILLYVYTRWQQPNLFTDVASADLPPKDSDDSANSGSAVIESLATLLEWNYEDPVDEWEMERNDLTQDVQGNRNVFIDYPELAWSLFGLAVPEGLVSPSTTGTDIAQYDTNAVTDYVVPEMTYDDPVTEPTLDYSNYKVEDGTYILYSPKYGMALSAEEVSTNYRAGVEYTVADNTGNETELANILWTVTRNADGTVSIKNTAGALATGASASYFNLVLDTTDASATVYASWNLQSDGEGNFFVQNSKLTTKYVHWGSNYQDFATAKYTGDEEDFAFKLLKIDGTAATGSVLTSDDISEVVIEREPASIEDGTYVIYNQASGVALSTTTTGYYLAGVAYTLNEDGTITSPAASEVWTIKNNEDGTITISNGENVLSMDTSYSSTPFGAVNDTWTLEKGGKTEGTYLIKNVGRGVYLEYYSQSSRFSGYELKEENEQLYEMLLIPATASSGSETTGTPTPTEPVVTDTPTPTDAPETIIEDGTYIVYNPSSAKAMSSEDISSSSTAYRKAVDYTLSETGTETAEAVLVWTVKNNEDGTVSLYTADGKALSVTSGKNNLTVGEDANTWNVVKNDDGTVYLVNTTTTKYLEYYAKYTEFSTYKFSESSADIYKLQFVTATASSGSETTGTPTPTATPTEEPTPTPTEGPMQFFELVTSVEDLADGKYIFVAKGDDGYYAMDNLPLSGGQKNARAPIAVEEDGAGIINSADASIVWTVTKTENGYTLQDLEGKFLGMTVSKNACFTANGNLDKVNEKAYYVVTANGTDGAMFFTNEVNTRSISAYVNKGVVMDFRGYVSTGSTIQPLYVYRLVDCETEGHDLLFDGEKIYCRICKEEIERSSFTGYIKTTDGAEVYLVAGELANGLTDVDGTELYFENGLRFTGEKTVECAVGSAVYTYEDGLLVDKNGFECTGENEYVAYADGAMLYGWQTIDGNVYYFDEETGIMALESVEIDGITYYFEDGKHIEGTFVRYWRYIRYYYAGEMVKGFATIDGETYYFDEDGFMIRGWLEVDGEYYYFYNDGTMATSTVYYRGVRYEIGEDGKLVSGTWVRYGRNYRYYVAGYCVTGLQEIDGETYYFDRYGYMVTGNILIDGSVYRFGYDGALVSTVELADYTGYVVINGIEVYVRNGRIMPFRYLFLRW